MGLHFIKPITLSLSLFESLTLRVFIFTSSPFFGNLKGITSKFAYLVPVSRVTTGISAFPLGWPWEAQSSPRVARESWGWRSSHCRAEETSPKRVSGT